MKILVFGNPLLELDNLAFKILPKLKAEFPDIEFKEFDPTESLEKEGRDLMILDVVQGISQIQIIDNIDLLELFKVRSMHDFDLAYNLKLLKKVGKIDSVRIIGLPIGMPEEEAFESVKDILNKIID